MSHSRNICLLLFLATSANSLSQVASTALFTPLSSSNQDGDLFGSTSQSEKIVDVGLSLNVSTTEESDLFEVAKDAQNVELGPHEIGLLVTVRKLDLKFKVPDFV